ncbi:glycoside hydrolase family 97 protein [Flagellimonas marina]|uniref:Glycoside hydrolase family 97 catalytic domain-containing protein n=1 Tax=Flagellimonas marina TaxID=1775168 RepID=A0ABV8PSI2_9FLAO
MKKIIFCSVLVPCILCLFYSFGFPTEQYLTSPDENHRITMIKTENGISFDYTFRGRVVLHVDSLGLVTNSMLTNDVSLKSVDKSSFEETWYPVIGKNTEVLNQYNEYTFHLQDSETGTGSYDIIFRCYNDGFAYRYVLHDGGENEIQILCERTKLRFSDDFTFWAYNRENANLGPLHSNDTSLTEVKIPMVVKTKHDLYLGIHEAAILRYAPATLKSEGKNLSFNVSETTDHGPITTSWRTFIVGDQPGDLVNSNLLQNLNEPCKIEDTSWIKPGKSMWDWRVWGYKAADGYEYLLDTKTHKRFIDFAADNNIQYLLIDADWYGPEFSADSDPTAASRRGFDIEECMAYAKDHDVGIILYLNDVGAKKFGLDRVLKQFVDWGAVGVKYGFMKGTWEEKVRHTTEVIEICAKYKLMVDFHDNPVPPSGDERTYPNLVTREFCHAQADAKRSYFPETAVSSAFINMIAGPLDYTNGWFDLNHAHSRERVFEEIPGTVTAEVAKLIVANTGWMVLPDAPEEYLKKDDLFDCIRKMPSQFDSFKVLQGGIDSYITVTRRAGEDWFVGSLTNREGRNLKINLDFLPEGKTYKATIYSDGMDAHFLNNKESYKIEEMEVEPKDILDVRLAPGGGNAIYLRSL